MTREEACKKAQIIDFQGGYTIALVTEIFNDHETQLKQRDEEIEMLQCRLYHAEGYIKDIHEPKEQ